ncbi:MAG: FG-GAP-like repeat-containing protein, partial [Bacteroidota bacterium]
QLNMGDNRYSEVGQLSGIHDTHWSWAPLMVDFDNDGLKDIMITNGYPKNVIDLDYVNYLGTEGMFGTKESIQEKLTKQLEKLNEIKLPNYFYKNHGNAQFEDVSEAWGFTTATVSNGAAYGDLDQDGDLDLVIHNINQPVMIYQNQSQELDPQNYLQVAFKGNLPNTSGIGASLQVWTQGQQQLYTHVPFRGFQSSMEPIAHFGLGSYEKVDSLQVIWADGSIQVLHEVEANQRILLEQTDATEKVVPAEKGVRVYQPYPADKLPTFTHTESPHVEFYQTPLIPHQMSMEGPGIAVGDVNGDGKEDVYLSGASGSNGSFLIQQADGSFVEKEIDAPRQIEETGVLLFDADGDTDLDLYAVSGGTEHIKGVALYQDRLYKNDGKGNFTVDSAALPDIKSSGSCVIAEDYDRDGDLDLFVGGRVVPGEYPYAPPSYLLRNEGGIFKDVSSEIPQLSSLGLVSAAIWTDYDEDGWQDLMVVGEWMPITLFHNQQGKLEKAGIPAFKDTEGWWNSILPVDVDRDGDLDYLVGNLGLNNPYDVSAEEPVKLFAKDFDANGTLDPIMAYHIQGKLHIAHARDAINKQIVKMKKRFTNYASYAAAYFDQVLLPQERRDALTLTAKTFASCVIINDGNSSFRMKPLPIEAQLAPLNGMLLAGFDEQGKSALILAGNDYSTRVDIGPYDALFGLMMETSDSGELVPVPKHRSGIDIPGDARGVVQLFVGDQSMVLAGQNDDELRIFTPTQNETSSTLWEADPLDQWVILHFENGTKVKKALSYGGGFLSQSSRKILIPATVKKLEVKNSRGEVREVLL